MPFTRAASVVEFNIDVQTCVSGGCAGSPISGRTMLECRVELQELAGVALRTFIPQEIGRNADDYGRMIWGSKSHSPPQPEISHTPEQHVHHTSAFRPLPFLLDRVPLSYPPSFSPPLRLQRAPTTLRM